MKIVFVGVGEAFDETVPNCSVWVRSGVPDSADDAGGRNILLDCGFTAPFSFWRVVEQPMELDAVWISHFHGDHFFGLPALLLRFWEEGRERGLHIAGQPGIEREVCAAMDAAYSGVRDRFGFEMIFHEIVPGTRAQVAGFTLETALSEHPKPNCALRLGDAMSTIFYSGDGRPTEASRALAQGADLVVHEAFSLDQDTPGHGTVPGAIEFGRQAGALFTALVHLRRDVRSQRLDEVRAIMERTCSPGLLLPMPGDSLDLSP